MSRRAREYTYWGICLAAALTFGFVLHATLTWWQGTALWVCVVTGRIAARISERRRAAQAAAAYQARMLRADNIEQAAQEAFWADDDGGHIAGGWTWNSIPPNGRENYRKLTRAVIGTALQKASKP